jgi:tRNA threonylcarbamoyladenosine biosynthesis protein TsaE
MEFQFVLEDLPLIASSFWEAVESRKLFAFHGEMGAGKTTIIEALCRAKGVKDSMGSPTFSIINEYVFMENGVQESIFHIDLYRLRNEEEIEQAGVEDTVYSGSICFVEWPQKAPYLFDASTVNVHLQVVDEKTRQLKIDLPS